MQNTSGLLVYFSKAYVWGFVPSFFKQLIFFKKEVLFRRQRKENVVVFGGWVALKLGS